MTLLHYVILGSHMELVKYLTKKEMNFGAKTKAWKIPLDLAINEEICSFMKEFEKLTKNGDSEKKIKMIQF